MVHRLWLHLPHRPLPGARSSTKTPRRVPPLAKGQPVTMRITVAQSCHATATQSIAYATCRRRGEGEKAAYELVCPGTLFIGDEGHSYMYAFL
jgi:hypothetical protein